MMILNRIKQIRKEKGLKVRDLAKLCDLSHSTITSVENFSSMPSHITMLLICRGLNKKLEDVFENDPSILDTYFGRNTDQAD